ncbi:hypothetical protein C4577_03730 [Candidatus Parcubacteria bacterium]|nr:MAG: hypothetical protein C4577_03730 [Candidatus Parcubacteria bacterium]
MVKANKPLQDDKKHEQTKGSQEEGEESASGHMPVAGTDEMGDVDKIAEQMGIYDVEEEGDLDKKDDTEDPVEEVDINKQLRRNNEG